MSTLLILKSGLTLNINEKHPASFTKTSRNCTPLGTISNNGRAKYSITKSLKQQFIDADAEWEGRQRGAATGRKEVFRVAESTSASETHSEEMKKEMKLNRKSESVTITDIITSISP